MRNEKECCRGPAKVLSLLARQTCRVSARRCGIPCAFWFVSQVASSENFCWGHAVGGLAGGRLVGDGLYS